MDTGNGVDLSSGNWLTHEFDYLDINNMADRLSGSQDWWGYNNGVNNNGTSLAPYIAGIASSVVNGNYGANRNPGSLSDMQKGLLKQVSYPTCGKQEFIYEPHTILHYTTSPTSQSSSLNGSGSGSSTTVTYTGSSFTSSSNQIGKLQFSSYKSPAFPDAPSGEGDKFAEVWIKKSGTGETVIYRKHYYYSDETFNVSLQNNVSYYMILVVKGEVNAATAFFSYNPGTSTSFENKIVGGVRVKEIKSYDPVAGNTNSRHYTYAASSDLSKSSGVGLLTPLMHIPYETGIINNAGTLYASTSVCNNYMVSSNSISPVFTFGGSPYAYSNVIESDDLTFVNGFTEHFFITYVASSPYYIVHGNTPLSTPANITTEDNGQEYMTRVFKRSGTNNILLKEIINNYERGDITNHKTSTIFRQRYVYAPITSPVSQSMFDGFDIVQYNYIGGWIILRSTETRDYDENGQNPITTTTTYTYNNLVHLQPTSIEASTNNGVKKVTNTYPVDHISQVSGSPNVYDDMVAKHMISPVIEQKSFITAPNTSTAEFLQKTFTTFSKFNNNTLIAPLSIGTSQVENGTYDTRLFYNKYSSSGNILEVQKAEDAKKSYIWGYAPEKPIAEVVNADRAEIAYTSFEAGTGTGEWTISSTARNSSSITGKASYDLQNGNISRALNSSKTYFISYWRYNGSALSSIIGNYVGYPITGRVSNGWTYIEHKISGQSSVTISGTGLIDELRMYPESSFMATYTYDPLNGITTVCDINNQITYFEYDGFGRLLHVKDIDKNVVKKYQYNYCEPLDNCTNTTPNWQATGVFRCVKNSNNNNTGAREQEEKNMNNCSSTYYQSRWVYYDTNTTACPAVSNCTGADKRVVNGVCEMGVRVVTHSYFSGGVQYCTYHYEWSDGYWSSNYQGSGNDCLEIW